MSNKRINKLSFLFEQLKEYINLHIDILSLTAGEKIALLLSKVLANSVIILFSILAFFFGSFAAAFALGAWLNSIALGFLLIAGLYILLVVIGILCKKKCIEKPLSDAFIRMVFKNNSEDNNE